MEELLTIEDICNMLKLARQTVYQLISNRKIPFVKISGRTVRFRSKEIQAWLEEKSRTPLRQASHTRGASQQVKKLNNKSASSAMVKRLVEEAKREILDGAAAVDLL